MTEQQIKQALLDALRDLRDNGPRRGRGICEEVLYWRCIDRPSDISQAVGEATLGSIMRRWPENSGDSDYPVPAADGGSPLVAFNRAGPVGRWTGPYGDSRRRLLAFCIDTLEAELAAQEATHE